MRTASNQIIFFKYDAIVYFNGEWWVSLSNSNGFNAYTNWLEDELDFTVDIENNCGTSF